MTVLDEGGGRLRGGARPAAVARQKGEKGHRSIFGRG